MAPKPATEFRTLSTSAPLPPFSMEMDLRPDMLTSERSEPSLTDPLRVREVASRAHRLQMIYGSKVHPSDAWFTVMRHAIALNASHLNTQRMV